MAIPEQTSAEVEGQHHSYFTNKIPWYVYLMWFLYGILFISYLLVNFLPALRQEILNSP